jgi:uncharacterized protein (UPF0335 family)
VGAISLHRLYGALAQEVRRHSYADAENTPKFLRLHHMEKFSSAAESNCPPAGIRSKVRGVFRIAGNVSALRQAQSGGSPLNQRLRSLIQQLGEAIHESVSESEQISDVVQDIRKQGFDVLLMLEATIGLNEVEQPPAAPALDSRKTENGGAGEPFNAQDVHVLQSLRISLEGEANSGHA